MMPRLVLCAIIVLFHWRLVFSGEYTWLEAPGVYEQAFPLMQFQAGEIHKWRLPLFDPYTNGGRPLLGWDSGVTAPWYPPHLAMLALPLKNGWLRQSILHWYFVLIQCAMALAMHRFARLVLKVPERAAVLAGVVYALGILAVCGADPRVLHACVWVPLAAMLGTFRTVRGTGSMGVFLGLCWLPGDLAVPVAATAALLATCILDRVPWSRLFPGFCLAFLIGAITIVPALAFGSIFWSGWQGPSAGVVAPILGIFGWFTSLRTPYRWILLTSAVAGVLHPSMLVFALAAGVALAAQSIANRWGRRWAVLVAAAATLAMLWSFVPWVQADNLDAINQIGLPAILAMATALLLWKANVRHAAYGVLVLFLADAAQPAMSAPWRSRYDKNRPRRLEAFAEGTATVAYLNRFSEEIPRTAIDPAAVPYAFGPWWGVETGEPAQFLISLRPAPGFDRLLFDSGSALKAYGAPGAVRSMRFVGDCPGGTLRIGARTPLVREFVISSRCPGQLHTGITDERGWVAILSGKSVAYTQETLSIPAGDHTVRLVFRPISLITGAICSVLGLAATWWLARRRVLKL